MLHDLPSADLVAVEIDVVKGSVGPLRNGDDHIRIGGKDIDVADTAVRIDAGVSNDPLAKIIEEHVALVLASVRVAAINVADHNCVDPIGLMRQGQNRWRDEFIPRQPCLAFGCVQVSRLDFQFAASAFNQRSRITRRHIPFAVDTERQAADCMRLAVGRDKVLEVSSVFVSDRGRLVKVKRAANKAADVFPSAVFAKQHLFAASNSGRKTTRCVGGDSGQASGSVATPTLLQA